MVLWVKNAQDGSEGFLVSDRVMNLVGESIRDFRIKLINELPPKTVNILINSNISPKGIKRDKNSECTELFNGEKMEQKGECL